MHKLTFSLVDGIIQEDARAEGPAQAAHYNGDIGDAYLKHHIPHELRQVVYHPKVGGSIYVVQQPSVKASKVSISGEGQGIQKDCSLRLAVIYSNTACLSGGRQQQSQ